MQEAILIFPNQLYKRHPGFSRARHVFLVEDRRFFHSFRFHKKKLLLHRASMQAYRDYLVSRGLKVEYIGCADRACEPSFFRSLARARVRTLHLVELNDAELQQRVTRSARRTGIAIAEMPDPGFLSPRAWLTEVFEDAERYHLFTFYVAQRKRLNILISDGKPVGAKWSFDPENRRKIPRGLPLPRLWIPKESDYVREARGYVNRHFPENPGATDDFIYPVTHRDARRWLKDFLENRLAYFGDYQDAMVGDEPFLFHSVLTPMLNIGLLTPDDIVRSALTFAKGHAIPLNSLEGFVRQIIGWREFIRAVSILAGAKQRAANFWRHKRPMPPAFYRASTGIEPVDAVIRRLHETAYAHHIERLMVLGNFMLLCEIDPDEVYRWFMELFIDAYDWVMVPNVYGMSQYADGGLMATKPYISSSNYLRKMSDFPRGRWCEIWDGLYWRFIYKHRRFFESNVRMRVMLRQMQRMGDDRIRAHRNVAGRFLRLLHAKER